MMELPIGFAIPKQVQEYVPIEPQYSLNKKSRWVWLQWALFWLLRKVGAKRKNMEVEFSTAYIDVTEASIMAILENANLLDFFYHRRPDVLLVGPDVYRGILTDDSLPFPIGFQAQTKMRKGNGTIEVMGFEIVMLPYMKGVLPLIDWQTHRGR